MNGELGMRSAELAEGKSDTLKGGHRAGTIKDFLPAYPTFADDEAEVIWLRGQLIRVLGEVGFLLELKRLNKDVEEAALDLYRLHQGECQRAKERVLVLERELARVLALAPQRDETKTALNGVKLKLGVLPPGEQAEACVPGSAFPNGRWASKDQGGLG